jgi:hypothetical protein
MPAGDVFGLDGFFLNKSNPIVVSTIGINSTDSSAGIAVTAGSFSSGTVTLNLSDAVGLSTTPFYTGAKIAVSGLVDATGVAHTGYNGTFVVTGFAGTTTVSYATTGYIGPVTAGITTTGLVMLVTDTQVTNTTWSSNQTHGWFGGGSPGSGTLSAVNRIDFSNDTITASPRGTLSLARQRLAATGNSNYGWFGGGSNTTPAIISTVDRIDFSNDSGTASPRSPLSLARERLAATGNSNYGWFGGGIIPSPAVVSTVDRIDFSNDSGTASLRSPLSFARERLASVGNSNYGWFGGGLVPGSVRVSTVDRIDFSNDLLASLPRGPIRDRPGHAATGNSNYGWFGGGGSTPPSSTFSTLSTIDRIDFSNDSTTASPRSTLSLARGNLAATGNSNYGWFGGGFTPPGNLSTVDRINFSNDSVTASPRGPLSSGRYSLAATSGQARSLSFKSLPVKLGFGWFVGGFTPPSTSSNRIDRINFSNDSATALTRGGLQAGVSVAPAATSNANYGFFTANNNVIDFSNDLIQSRIDTLIFTDFGAYSSATGNYNYGWFGGGSPGARTSVTRLNYSNFTAATTPRGLLSQGRYGLEATGNSNYGWFAGGANATPTIVNTVDRIDFSNDFISASPRGSLIIPNLFVAATGNSNYGWFGGGYLAPGPVRYSRIQRIDFSNDSILALLRSQLTAEKSGASASGNSNYGWFGGGFVAPGFSTIAAVDRIDFSNDLASASPRGPLSQSRGGLASVSNVRIG